MKYTGNVCAGCNQLMNDEDDIVVCPECGTPQHRECYDKEGKCVNAHLHAENYSWQGITKTETPLAPEKKVTIPCPNCGYENEKGATVCKHCGMKFTLFGMNVVDAMHQQEEMQNLNQNRDIPTYNPPFKLGEDDCFNKEEADERKEKAQQIEGLLTDILSGNADFSEENDGRLNLGGPFPVTDEIDGVRTNSIGNFVASNAMNYIQKFKALSSGKRTSFNFGAFFLAPYWFFFRKLYKAGIVCMTVLISMTIVITPYLEKMMEGYEEFLLMIQSPEIDEALFEQVYTNMMTSSTPAVIYFFLTVFIHLVCGFIATPLYKKYVLEHAGKAERMENKNAAMAYIVKNGGASILIGIASYFAMQLISSLLISFLQ